MSPETPPFLFPDFSAGFAKVLCADPMRWRQLSQSEVVDELLSLTRPAFGLLHILDDTTTSTIVGAFYKEIRASDSLPAIASSASLAFLEECQVKLKREFYGEEGSREPFNPRLEGRHHEEFNRACEFLARVIIRMESRIQEPYFCPRCSIYGARQALVFEGRTRVCLGCVADYRHITDRYYSITRLAESRGSDGPSEAANSLRDENQRVQPAAQAQEARRRDTLHACLEAADESGAKLYWVTAETLIDEARKLLLPTEVSRKSIRRELVLHTLDHPERYRFPVDRVGAYFFQLMPPDRFKLLNPPLEELPARTGSSATKLRPVEFDAVFRLRLGGEFKMLEPSKVMPAGMLQPLEEFVKRQMVTGVVVVVSGRVYQGALSARVLIGRIYQTPTGTYVVK